MRIDPKKVRAILLKLEDESQKEPELSEQELLEYMIDLQARGFVDAYIQKDLKGEPVGYKIKAITPLGRDYLTVLKKEAVPFKIIGGLKWAIALVLGVVLDEVVRHCIGMLWK